MCEIIKKEIQGVMLGRIGFAELLIVPLLLIIPAALLYCIIKLAVKNAIKELKNSERL